MGTRYNIVITATDRALATVRAIKAGVGQVVKPITDVGKSVKALGKEVGVDKLAGGLKNLAGGASNALKAIGGLSPAMAGFAGVGGLVALAGYTRSMVNAQAATLRFSLTTGVAADRIQVLESGAKLAGLQAGDLDGALQNLGTTLQDARWGRNQGALMLMNRLGLRMKTTKTGAIDTEAALDDLADLFGPGGKLAGAPAQTKMLVAQQFGVEALLPVLMRGKKAWEDYKTAAARVKPPLTEEDLKRADKYRQSIDLMALSFDGLGQSITKATMPALAGLADWITQHNVNAQKNIQKYGIAGAIGRGAAETLKDIVRGPYDKLSDNVKDIGNLIGAGEGGYNSVNTGKKGGYKSAKTNLVESSIQSVMAAQEAGDFNAAGKYQITKETLKQAVAALHLDTSQKFDQATQEKIFRQYLIQMKRPEIGDYVSGKSNDLRAAVKAASKEWASVADPDTGQSHYAGVANNKSSITADKMAEALKAARQAATNKEETRPRYVIGSDKAAEADLAAPSDDTGTAAAPPPADGKKAAGDLPGVWQQKPQMVKTDSTVTVRLQGLPAGAKADVVQDKGPVKTVLKVESSMPDYSL